MDAIKIILECLIACYRFILIASVCMIIDVGRTAQLSRNKLLLSRPNLQEPAKVGLSFKHRMPRTTKGAIKIKLQGLRCEV